LNVLLSCGAFHSGSDASPNISGYCNKSLDEKMEKAMTAARTDPAAANDIWAEIDHEATDDAPWATLFSPNQLDFISTKLQRPEQVDLLEGLRE
jgi:peptide/nickel transport system substrate-binding protein